MKNLSKFWQMEQHLGRQNRWNGSQDGSQSPAGLYVLKK